MGAEPHWGWLSTAAVSYPHAERGSAMVDVE
jgi:hypothetical protein